MNNYEGYEKFLALDRGLSVSVNSCELRSDVELALQLVEELERAGVSSHVKWRDPHAYEGRGAAAGTDLAQTFTDPAFYFEVAGFLLSAGQVA